MARKPSIILTVADKRSAATDLRGELKVAKARLKEALAIVKGANKAVEVYEKEVAGLTAKIAVMV